MRLVPEKSLGNGRPHAFPPHLTKAQQTNPLTFSGQGGLSFSLTGWVQMAGVSSTKSPHRGGGTIVAMAPAVGPWSVGAKALYVRGAADNDALPTASLAQRQDAAVEQAPGRVEFAVAVDLRQGSAISAAKPPSAARQRVLRRAAARAKRRRQWAASRQVDGENDSRFPTQRSATVDCDWLWVRQYSDGAHRKRNDHGNAGSRACTVRLTSATRVDDGQWHFIALTWAHATSNATLYIDGVAEAARWMPLSDDRPGFVVKVGEATPHFPRPSYFFGKLSALWHWREALEPLFVQRLAAPANSPVEAPSAFAYARSQECVGVRKLAACSAAQRKAHRGIGARSGMPSSSHFQLRQPLSHAHV